MTATRGDEFAAQFLADVRDVDFDEVRQAVVVLAVEMFVNHRAGDEPAGVQGQQLY